MATGTFLAPMGYRFNRKAQTSAQLRRIHTMIFQHTWQQVLNGTKTQTRRLVTPRLNHARPGTVLTYDAVLPENIGYEYDILAVHSRTEKVGGWLTGSYAIETEFSDYLKWQVGRTYAVQLGRGEKAIARIEITGIRREDVRNITMTDTHAEGFNMRGSFWQTWTQMHDYNVYREMNVRDFELSRTIMANKFWIEKMSKQPSRLYDAWVLEFELAKENTHDD
jgi:hypothetical protein